MRKIVSFSALLILCVASFLAIHGCSDANTQVPSEVEATASWGPPTYGTPVEHYVLQYQVNLGGWATITTTTDTFFVLTIPYAADSQVRVAGVDADGRQGPWSLPSNLYNPSEAMPGIPTNVRLYIINK